MPAPAGPVRRDRVGHRRRDERRGRARAAALVGRVEADQHAESRTSATRTSGAAKLMVSGERHVDRERGRSALDPELDIVTGPAAEQQTPRTSPGEWTSTWPIRARTSPAWIPACAAGLPGSTLRMIRPPMSACEATRSPRYAVWRVLSEADLFVPSALVSPSRSRRRRAPRGTSTVGERGHAGTARRRWRRARARAAGGVAAASAGARGRRVPLRPRRLGRLGRRWPLRGGRTGRRGARPARQRWRPNRSASHPTTDAWAGGSSLERTVGPVNENVVKGAIGTDRAENTAEDWHSPWAGNRTNQEFR